MDPSLRRRRWRTTGAVLLISVTVVAAAYIVLSSPSNPFTDWLQRNPDESMKEQDDQKEENEDRQPPNEPEATTSTASTTTSPKQHNTFPSVLLENVYDGGAVFRNERGAVPSFWDELSETTWGPCYPTSETVDWTKEMERWHGSNETDYHSTARLKRHDTDMSDYCRPGFVIVGAGKCGTSSLYHYLVGHPRVLPASEKQIHYFKYHTSKGLKWYLAHFPTATSFLSAGALMTGEASPGYLPYPNVAAITAEQMPGTKILAIGRHPLERAWSSYNYNYVNPTMSKLRQGGMAPIPANKPDEYYEQYLFSFEDLIRSELQVLRECFAPGGIGEESARKTWGNKEWAKAEFERRKKEGLPSLIDLDEHCYGDRVSNKVPRKQWKDLLEQYPNKIVDTPYMFLTQALLGRSLYVFPLEWWYITFPKEDIYFLCTEELKDLTGEPLNQVGQFLGLPSYDFSGVVGEGMYNVGGHTGYDTATDWEQVKEERPVNSTVYEETIPLSVELRAEVEEFVKPYNERLFELVGRRCDW